ncbi:hypothetical protein [Janthinobacterium sp. 17J80-10]|uniref:hypothetical protein n=1 Tax=Janthinobacterium sp. 17J80-10 TaxID=2497863 RepID=UPI0010058452|nr:hypothetical protein [Janthinobacterium sp. 17J80-10]QAU35340.1 hypothetical protein EKL02_14800 [Janthinobacterium sp. 17J80-10]
MKHALYSSTLIAIALAASATAAQAGDRSGVNWSVSVGTPAPAVVYAPPPAVYSYPQPVYVQPQPVYVEQAPVVVYGAPGPVVYGQPYYAERPRHHHHHNRDYNGGNFRQGNDHYRGRD